MIRPTIINTKFVNVTWGENVVIIEPSNISGCEVQDNVFIGPFVEIHKNTLIGARTRIQSHTSIGENVAIGEDCYIGRDVSLAFGNSLDKYSIHSSKLESKRYLKIGDNVMIGSNATIHFVSICSRVVIGPGSVVTDDIIESGIYVGNPARKISDLPRRIC